MCRRSFSSKPKVQSLSSSRFIQKKCKSTLNNISASTHLKRKYKKTIKNEPVITKKRQRNQMVLKENCSSDLSILNLLTMIGEQGQSNFEMNNKNLHKYTDREVLKISNSWSKSISSEESEILQQGKTRTVRQRFSSRAYDLTVLILKLRQCLY